MTGVMRRDGKRYCQCVRAVCPCSSSPGVSFLVGPGSGGDVLIQGQGPGSWCGEGGSAPFDPKSPFSFLFFNHPEEGNWVGLVSQSVKVLRVGGSDLTV